MHYQCNPTFLPPHAIMANKANTLNIPLWKVILFSRNQLLIFAGVRGELTVVVRPLELQRPAPFRKASEHEAVPFQVDLWKAWLCFKVWHNVIWNIKEKRERKENKTEWSTHENGIHPINQSLYLNRPNFKK